MRVLYVHSCGMEGGKVSFPIPHEATSAFPSPMRQHRPGAPLRKVNVVNMLPEGAKDAE